MHVRVSKLLVNARCLLVLTLLCDRGASEASGTSGASGANGTSGVKTERRWIRGEYKNGYRPPAAEGGPFAVSPMKPDKAFRWTFEGINYDSPPHQVATAAANKEYSTCVGDYARCLLRESKPTEICAFDQVDKYYYRFYSICDVEYQNCNYALANFGWRYKTLDHTMNRFLYDGDSWVDDYHVGKYWSWFAWHSWYCYWADIQFLHQGMRRAGPDPPTPARTIA